MRVAVLGGGMAGLAAAYDLANQSQNVEIFESAPFLGGLASGFTTPDWEWPLERAYHHIFASDQHIIALLREVGYGGVTFSTPTTTSLYEKDGVFSCYPLDGPLELVRFPLLALPDKIRAGLALAVFKLTPFLPYYEHYTTEQILQSWMGDRAYRTIFAEMFRKKFGKYAGNILASFIWSRIHMRTKRLGYMEGGFQSMVEHVAGRCTDLGAKIYTRSIVRNLSHTPNGLLLTVDHEGEERKERFDRVISTLPSPVFTRVASTLLPDKEIARMRAIRHLSAVNLIIETDKPVFERGYWISVCTSSIPALVFVQHTNFVDRSHYGGRHILYIASYCEPDDYRMQLDKDQMLTLYLPTIQKIAKDPFKVYGSHLLKAHHAQPIFDKSFLESKPLPTTSNPHLFLANLDMTYPFDRGTNYAVKLGREAADLVLATR